MIGNTEVPYIIMGTTVGLWGGIQLIQNRRLNNKPLTIILLCYVLSGLLDCFFIGNETFFDICSDLLTYCIAIVMFVYPIKYYQGVISFYVSCAFFVSAFFSGSLTHGLLTSSGNYISILLILAASIYYIGLQNKTKQFRFWDVIPALLCFLLSIWAMGRGGIISTAFLLILVVGILFRQKIQKGKVIYKFLFVLVIVAVAFILYKEISLIDQFMTLGKLGHEGLETPRPQMWASYLSKMAESPIYILLGTPLEQVRVLHEIGNNCHNSFLQLHAYNGVVILCGFVYLLIKSIVYMYKNKLYALLAITLTIVMRGMTDKFIFGQYGMPIMLYLVFYPFAYVRKNKLAKVKLILKLKQDGKRI
jgi:hypothetical protein